MKITGPLNIKQNGGTQVKLLGRVYYSFVGGFGVLLLFVLGTNESATFPTRLLMSVNLLRTAERPHSLRFLPGHSHTLEVWERLLYNCVCHGVWNAIWPLHLPSDRAERQMSSHTVKLTVVDNVTGGSPIPASWSLCKRVKETALQAAK